MKAIYSLIAMVMVLGFTSCSSSEDFDSVEVATFESVKSLYGLEELTTGSIAGGEQVPLTTVNEMHAALEALRSGSNTQHSCIVENSKNGFFGDANEVAKKVVMASQYQATTKTGTEVDNFQLRVELNFTIDKGQVYYVGTDYTYSSELFIWRANGLSLAPVKNAEGFTYEFKSESFLYFRLADQGNCLVKVPVVFKGNFDFNAGKGTYSFQLLKGAK